MSMLYKGCRGHGTARVCVIVCGRHGMLGCLAALALRNLEGDLTVAVENIPKRVALQLHLMFPFKDSAS